MKKIFISLLVLSGSLGALASDANEKIRIYYYTIFRTADSYDSELLTKRSIQFDVPKNLNVLECFLKSNIYSKDGNVNKVLSKKVTFGFSYDPTFDNPLKKEEYYSVFANDAKSFLEVPLEISIPWSEVTPNLYAVNNNASITRSEAGNKLKCFWRTS